MSWHIAAKENSSRSYPYCVDNVGAKTIRIVKPYADKNKIFAQHKKVEEGGALAGVKDTSSFDPTVVHLRNF